MRAHRRARLLWAHTSSAGMSKSSDSAAPILDSEQGQEQEGSGLPGPWLLGPGRRRGQGTRNQLQEALAAPWNSREPARRAPQPQGVLNLCLWQQQTGRESLQLGKRTCRLPCRPSQRPSPAHGRDRTEPSPTFIQSLRHACHQ